VSFWPICTAFADFSLTISSQIDYFLASMQIKITHVLFVAGVLCSTIACAQSAPTEKSNAQTDKVTSKPVDKKGNGSVQLSTSSTDNAPTSAVQSENIDGGPAPAPTKLPAHIAPILTPASPVPPKSSK
jgi:hypothetical protein